MYLPNLATEMNQDLILIRPPSTKVVTLQPKRTASPAAGLTMRAFSWVFLESVSSIRQDAKSPEVKQLSAATLADATMRSLCWVKSDMDSTWAAESRARALQSTSWTLCIPLNGLVLRPGKDRVSVRPCAKTWKGSCLCTTLC